MNYINIYPYFEGGRFWARIDCDNIPEEISFPVCSIFVVARRSDGKYSSKSIDLPDSNIDMSDVRLDMFSLMKGEYGQIISVKVGGIKVGLSYGIVSGISDYSFRYNDSICFSPSYINEPTVLDFQVLETNDPKVLLVADNSTWGMLEDIDAVIDITVPSGDVPISHYFSKHNVNIFNSVTLVDCDDPLSTNDLPDGIYFIELKSAGGLSFPRYYFRSVLLRAKIDKMYVNCTLDCDKINQSMIDNINKIEIYLAGAEAHMRLGNPNKACYYYSLADKLSDKCGC